MLPWLFVCCLDTGDEEVMNQVALPIIDDATCQSHWNDFLPATELCAGYENGGKDFCGVVYFFNLCFKIPRASPLSVLWVLFLVRQYKYNICLFLCYLLFFFCVRALCIRGTH